MCIYKEFLLRVPSLQVLPAKKGSLSQKGSLLLLRGLMLSKGKVHKATRLVSSYAAALAAALLFQKTLKRLNAAPLVFPALALFQVWK